MPLEKDEKSPEADAPALEPGFHVMVGKDHNSGPYATEEDAKAFIDGHLEGKGKIQHVTADEASGE